MSSPENPPSGGEKAHPLFGALAGDLTIPADIDWTAPTCPDWEAYAERKYGPDSKLGKIWAEYVNRQIERDKHDQTSDAS